MVSSCKDLRLKDSTSMSFNKSLSLAFEYASRWRSCRFASIRAFWDGRTQVDGNIPGTYMTISGIISSMTTMVKTNGTSLRKYHKYNNSKKKDKNRPYLNISDLLFRINLCSLQVKRDPPFFILSSIRCTSFRCANIYFNPAQ